MGAGGRPPAFDADKAKKICAAVSGGMPMAQAAELVEVSERTIQRWMRRPEPEYRQFCRDIRKARAKALQFRLNRIKKNGKSNPKCDMWWCERMFPESFGTDRRLINELLAEIARLRAEQGGGNADGGGDRGRSAPPEEAGGEASGNGDGI